MGKKMTWLPSGPVRGLTRVLGDVLSSDPTWVHVTKCQSIGIIELNASDVVQGPEKGCDLSQATHICGRDGNRFGLLIPAGLFT